MINLKTLLYLAILVGPVVSFKHFQHKIPNGERVPHPCKPNFIWDGVGHKNENGGGSRNPFGLDFFSNGKKWDGTLCRLDSDGDGKTNGEELGDPECVWTEGATASITLPTELSHPGVCTPYESEACINRTTDWVSCDATAFTCDADETDLLNITFKFPETPVPNKETNYFCMLVDYPSDRDYHIVGTQPQIDNAYVMHHILLYGCDVDAEENLRQNFASPAACGMGADKCTMIGGWTLGGYGGCHNEDFGIKIGKTGYKLGLLQYHWNNPELKSDYTDSSGFTIYYTPSTRTHDAAILTVGQMYLEIFPSLPSTTFSFQCPTTCTEKLPRAVYLTGVNLHMHYLGKSITLNHYRGENKIATIAKDATFIYDSPVFHSLSPEAQFLPGDKLEVECEYDSTVSTKTVYYGDATSAEMCFAFVTYYPKNPIFENCVGYKSVALCEGQVATQGCNMNSFWIEEAKTVFTAIGTACYFGCTPGCSSAITEARMHPCLAGDVGEYIENVMAKSGEKGEEVLEYLYACTNHTMTTSPNYAVAIRSGYGHLMLLLLINQLWYILVTKFI